MLGSAKVGVQLVTERSREFERIKSHMDGGNALRRRTGVRDILAMYAVAQIAEKRPKDALGGDVTQAAERYMPGIAYVLHSLKTPDEVATLRQVYGAGFFLLGVHSGSAERRRYFRERKHLADAEIEELIDRDDNERGDPFGQRTRDTFHLADAFVSLDHRLEPGLTRLVRLLFGDPYQSPTEAEHAMFLAFATSLRSADLSRQVGAALFSARGDLVSTGANDVPRSGGGQYWPGRTTSGTTCSGWTATSSRSTRLWKTPLSVCLAKLIYRKPNESRS
jgi:deoxycytidylate deaminase